MKRAVTRSVAVLLCASLLSALVCTLLYRYDNKYTRRQPFGLNGALMLDSGGLKENPVIFLVHGWEVYSQRLLSPADFASGSPVPDAYISIGEYMGFELDDSDAEPHGSATYRLRIAVPPEKRSYSLELPEIFSACRVYINGDLMASRGKVGREEDYRPELKTGIVTFQAAKRIEIIIQASDYSNIYSGLVYPPAFGEPEAAALVINRRLLLRALVCVAAILIAVCAFVFGKGSRKMTAYGFACICCAGFGGYPILHAAGFSGPFALLRIENLCFILMLLTVSYLQGELCRAPKPLMIAAMAAGGAVFVCALLSPLFFQSLAGMLLYSMIIRLYKYAVAVYLLFLAVRAAVRGTRVNAMLAGTASFGVSVLMDRLLPLHEPILTGYLIEFGGTALCLCAGLDLIRNALQIAGERAVLRENLYNLTGLFRMQKQYYKDIDKDIENARISQHDMRHHVLLMQELLSGGDYDKLGEYLRAWGNTVENSAVTVCCSNHVADALFRHYSAVSRERGVCFTVEADVPQELAVTDTELCGLLGNLLENAFEAATRLPPEKRRIKACIRRVSGNLFIVVENSFMELPVMIGDSFLSRKRGNANTGTGLAAVSRIAERYNGRAEFDVDTEACVFRAVVQLIDVCMSAYV